MALFVFVGSSFNWFSVIFALNNLSSICIQFILINGLGHSRSTLHALLLEERSLCDQMARRRYMIMSDHVYAFESICAVQSNHRGADHIRRQLAGPINEFLLWTHDALNSNAALYTLGWSSRTCVWPRAEIIYSREGIQMCAPVCVAPGNINEFKMHARCDGN